MVTIGGYSLDYVQSMFDIDIDMKWNLDIDSLYDSIHK